MKRRRTESFEDVLRATGPAWEELPDGFDLVIRDAPVQAERDRLTITLPHGAVKAFKPRTGDRLHARVSRGKLIIERGPRKVPRKSSRG